MEGEVREYYCPNCNKSYLSDIPGACPNCWGNSAMAKPDVNLDKMVHHPPHYTTHPSGVECIRITEHMNFCLGNAIKYIWRHAEKGGIEDLKKARWYLDREIGRLTAKGEG